MNETTKLNNYRKLNGYDKYFRGVGIDIGCGNDVLDPSVFDKIIQVTPYDLINHIEFDANSCSNLKNDSFDFVYSSHCLEHTDDPYKAFQNWIRICKPGGYLIVAIPHEIFYEKCQWPSKFNSDHKTSWTLEFKSNLPKSTSTKDFLNYYSDTIKIIRCETILQKFDFNRFQEDQTREDAICQIEFVVQKI